MGGLGGAAGGLAPEPEGEDAGAAGALSMNAVAVGAFAPDAAADEEAGTLKPRGP